MNRAFFISKTRMAESQMKMETVAEYHSKDFEFAEIEEEIKSNPSLHYHLAPVTSSNPSSSSSDPWRIFHRRHSKGKFFKERRYILKEFPELNNSGDFAKVLEVGCGNGSTVLPILRAKQGISVYACDCSPEVLEIAKGTLAMTNIVSVKDRFHPFLLDFSENAFPNWLFCTKCQNTSLEDSVNYVPDINPAKCLSSTTLNEPLASGGVHCCIGGCDFVTLIFTLSAVPSKKMPFVLEQCFSVLKPGCLLLFRDYGIYDMTMLRFPPEQRVGYREYMRLDGTLSYFFSLESARELFLRAGFIELELDYCCVSSLNRRNGKKMQRIWVHGKFQKPLYGYWFTLDFLCHGELEQFAAMHVDDKRFSRCLCIVSVSIFHSQLYLNPFESLYV